MKNIYYEELLSKVPPGILIDFFQNNINFIHQKSNVYISSRECVLQFLFQKTHEFNLDFKGKIRGISSDVLYRNGITRNFQLVILAEFGGISIQSERKDLIKEYLFQNNITEEIYNHLLSIQGKICKLEINTFILQSDCNEFPEFFIDVSDEVINKISIEDILKCVFNRKIDYQNSCISLPQTFLPKLFGRKTDYQRMVIGNYLDVVRGRVLKRISEETLNVVNELVLEEVFI